MEDSESEIKLRTAQQVAERCIVLYALCLAAKGELSRSAAVMWLKTENLWSTVSPREKQFFENPNPPHQSVVDATWRAETLWTLLWTLKKVPELGEPCSVCNPQDIIELMPTPDSSTKSFVEDAELRDGSVISEETDHIFEAHWAIRDARLNEREIPNGYSPGVVIERHFALNWITYYEDDWDEVTTDT